MTDQSPTTSLGQRLSRAPRAVLSLTLALVAGGIGAYWIWSAPSSVTTDNAYLKADTAQIAPRIRGLVAEVTAADQQPVKAGDPLVRIEDEDYRSALGAAEADLARARANVSAAEAALARNLAEIDLSNAAVREAEARIRAADAESRRSNRDRDRYSPLSKLGYASVQKFEAASAGSEAASAEAVRVRAALDVARAQARVAISRTDELTAHLRDCEAQTRRAAAMVNLAQIDLDHTIIRAPADGIIGDRHVERGEYVQPGTRLMVLVPKESLYVMANFKETQTGRMRVGQPAVIEVDALPGRRFRGTVESLSPASGSEFALLPFEPGTGNFTKIVQRLPVRIRLEPEALADPTLRPGLSITARVSLEG